MNHLLRIYNLLKVLLKLNLVKTIYFNFNYLPFIQAKKLPVYFYGETKLEIYNGEFIIKSSKISSGMIVFGGRHEMVIKPLGRTRIFNTGKIIFNGNIKFGIGVNIMVREPGMLSFGNNVAIGSMCNIISFREIHFGNNILVSWDCQFFDTDFHFIKNVDNQVKDNTSNVIIEDNVWIGTKVLVLKNTLIGRNSIIGSGSLCNKNYVKLFGENVLLAGNPINCFKQNIEYIKDKKTEMKLWKYFSENNLTEIDLKKI